MTDYSAHQQRLLWALKLLGGHATIADIAARTELTVTQIGELLTDPAIRTHVEPTPERGWAHGGHILDLRSDLSDVPCPPVVQRNLINQHAAMMVADHGDGLNTLARNVLQAMLIQLYVNPAQSSPLVVHGQQLRPFEMEIVERRARDIVAACPLPQPGAPGPPT